MTEHTKKAENTKKAESTDETVDVVHRAVDLSDEVLKSGRSRTAGRDRGGAQVR
jgi:hypothetical protein